MSISRARERGGSHLEVGAPRRAGEMSEKVRALAHAAELGTEWEVAAAGWLGRRPGAVGGFSLGMLGGNNALQERLGVKRWWGAVGTASDVPFDS